MNKDLRQRRLAAIMMADVVGYSHLMELDEAGTIARLKSRRASILTPVVRAYGGRLVKVMGDGVFIEFASAVGAVAAALDLQAKMAAANTDAPDERAIVLRVGINSGDVIGEGTDVYGEVVNIAARLESLAEPGGICITGTVCDEARGKVQFTALDLGERPLKNIQRAVRVYRIGPAGEVPGNLGPTIALPCDRVSVAVLPFDNMSGPGDEYFADGLMEDLITALAKSRYVSVIARNSTYAYKNKAVKVQEVGRELGARYLVEGSVRRSGNRVRVTAQLLNAETGAHLWAERFDREREDIFSLQDEIVTAIVTQLTFSLVDAAAGTRIGPPTRSMTAYDHVLRGRSAWRRGACLETLDHYRRAAESDPNYAAALAGLAFYYAYDIYMQITGDSINSTRELGVDYAQRALAADDGDPFVHQMVGAAFVCLGDPAKARHHLELAVALDPYYPNAVINLAMAIAWMGEHRKALSMVEGIFQLEPRLAPAIRTVPFHIHLLVGNCDAAIEDLGRIEKPLAYAYLLLGVCLRLANRPEEAKHMLSVFELSRTAWFDVLGFARYWSGMFILSEDRERWREGFRQTGHEI